jgi:hypothetical protein
MLLKTLTPLISATLAVVSLAGCSDTPSNPKLAHHDSNFFNIVTVKPDSFAYTPAYSAELHSNDVISRPNISGTQVTLLCGLITYNDY